MTEAAEAERAERYAALEAIAVDIEDEEDPDEVLAQLGEVRRDVGERRRRTPAH